MAELRISPQKITRELLTHRLDCSFYHPDAIQLDYKLKEYGHLKKLAEIIDPKRTITNGVRGPALQSSNYYLVRLQDCKDWEIDFYGCLTISEKQFKENKRCQLQEDDVVVAIGGYVGNASIVRYVQPAVIGQHSAILPNNSQFIDGRYLVAYLNSKWGAIQLQRYVSGTIQPGVNLEDLREIPIPIPHPKIQSYIGDKVRQVERLRDRSRKLENEFRDILGKDYPDIFGKAMAKGKSSHAELDVLTTNLNPGAYEPERLRIRRYLKDKGGKQIQSIALIETNVASQYSASDIYIGLDAISSASCTISPSTIGTEKITGGARILTKGVAISKLRPYLNKVTYIPSELDGALGSTELFCIKPKNNVSDWFIYGVLKLDSTVRQLNPVSTGSTHPRVSREDILDLMIPWSDKHQFLGEQLEMAQKGYFISENLTAAAKLLVEALIEGKLSEADLKAAQEGLEKGDTTLDREILDRLTRKGIDFPNEPPLFPNLDALYAALASLEATETTETVNPAQNRVSNVYHLHSTPLALASEAHDTAYKVTAEVPE